MSNRRNRNHRGDRNNEDEQSMDEEDDGPDAGPPAAHHNDPDLLNFLANHFPTDEDHNPIEDSFHYRLVQGKQANSPSFVSLRADTFPVSAQIELYKCLHAHGAYLRPVRRADTSGLPEEDKQKFIDYEQTLLKRQNELRKEMKKWSEATARALRMCGQAAHAPKRDLEYLESRQGNIKPHRTRYFRCPGPIFEEKKIYDQYMIRMEEKMEEFKNRKEFTLNWKFLQNIMWKVYFSMLIEAEKKKKKDEGVPKQKNKEKGEESLPEQEEEETKMDSSADHNSHTEEKTEREPSANEPSAAYSIFGQLANIHNPNGPVNTQYGERLGRSPFKQPPMRQTNVTEGSIRIPRVARKSVAKRLKTAPTGTTMQVKPVVDLTSVFDSDNDRDYDIDDDDDIKPINCRPARKHHHVTPSTTAGKTVPGSIAEPPSHIESREIRNENGTQRRLRFAMDEGLESSMGSVARMPTNAERTEVFAIGEKENKTLTVLRGRYVNQGGGWDDEKGFDRYLFSLIPSDDVTLLHIRYLQQGGKWDDGVGFDKYLCNLSSDWMDSGKTEE